MWKLDADYWDYITYLCDSLIYYIDLEKKKACFNTSGQINYQIDITDNFCLLHWQICTWIYQFSASFQKKNPIKCLDRTEYPTCWIYYLKFVLKNKPQFFIWLTFLKCNQYIFFYQQIFIHIILIKGKLYFNSSFLALDFLVEFDKYDFLNSCEQVFKVLVWYLPSSYQSLESNFKNLNKRMIYDFFYLFAFLNK